MRRGKAVWRIARNRSRVLATIVGKDAGSPRAFRGDEPGRRRRRLPFRSGERLPERVGRVVDDPFAELTERRRPVGFDYVGEVVGRILVVPDVSGGDAPSAIG